MRIIKTRTERGRPGTEANKKVCTALIISIPIVGSKCIIIIIYCMTYADFKEDSLVCGLLSTVL